MYRCLFSGDSRQVTGFYPGQCQQSYMSGPVVAGVSSKSSVMLSDASFFSLRVSDVTCNPADAAHADPAVSAPQRRTAQAGSGRGSGRTPAEVSGAKQGSSNEMQAEEKSVGDVVREESRRAHSDQHAASGTNS